MDNTIFRIKHWIFRKGMILCLLGVPGLVQAELIQVRDQNPLVLVFGLPLPGVTELPEAGHSKGILAYNQSNTINIEANASESLYFDGEAHVTDFLFYQGLGRDWSIGMHVPLIGHSGGSLDALIADFHRALNLPNGGRESVPRDQLAYRYTRNGEPLLDFTQAAHSVGDIRLLLGYQWQDSGRDRAVLYTQFKLPTGDPDKLSGSGAFDYSNWFTARRQLLPNWVIQGYLGLARFGRSQLNLPQYQNVFFGGLGLEWSPRPRLQLRVQADYHGRVIRGSRINLLGSVINVSGGVSVRFLQDTYLDLSIVEDALVGASPDVNFQAAVRYQFSGGS